MTEQDVSEARPESGFRAEDVEFVSEGVRLRGVLKSPRGTPPERGWPIIVHGPGWLETVGHPLSLMFHEGLVAGGYAVLQFDYRGFGASDGEPGWLRPAEQQIDIGNAITYAGTRDDLDLGRLGLFAFGGTGGGNAMYVASRDPRVKAVCAQTVVADGTQWLREQRREYEWVEFLSRVAEDRRRRVLGEPGELVDPTEEIMVASPERRKKGMPTRGAGFHLASVEHLSQFRPVDVVGRLTTCGLLLTCVENDVVTPEHHARELYAAAGGDKKLLVQRGVNHYEAYTANCDVLMGHFLDWYDRHLVVGRTVSKGTPHAEVVEVER